MASAGLCLRADRYALTARSLSIMRGTAGQPDPVGILLQFEVGMMNIFQNDAGAVSVPAGQTIFKHGEPSLGKMFAVSQGEVDIQINSHTVETIGPGGIFGEMGLIDDCPRSADAVARTNAKVVSIDERRFNFLVQNNPFFALQVMRVMTDRIRRLSENPK